MMPHKLSVYLMFAVCLVADLLAVAVANEESCVSNYNEFQHATFSKSTSNQFELHRVFYPPNGRHPYSVKVTYQKTLSNGTVVDIITVGAGYNNTVWVWLSSPVFLHGRPEFFNLLTLHCLNNFVEWVPLKVSITVPCPCKNRTFDFLEAMTSSLADYAAGEFLVKVHRGSIVVVNVSHGFLQIWPSKSSKNFTFHETEIIFIMWTSEFVFLSLFLWAVSFALIKYNVEEFVKKMTDHSYQYYGLAWGGCVVALGLTIAVWYGIIKVLMEGKPTVPQETVVYVPYIFFGLLFCVPGVLIALYFAYKTSPPPPVPYMFLPLCCCKKKRYEVARSIVFGLGLLIYMMGSQSILNTAIIMLFVMIAEPLLVITNTFIVILLAFCVTNILALLFTISAYVTDLCPCSRSKPQKCITITKAIVILPLFFGIVSFCLMLAASGSNITDNPSSILSIIGSAILPIILLSLTATLNQLFVNAQLWKLIPFKSLSGDVRRHGNK